MSCREVVTRHLRIFVSDGIINERKKIRRSRSPRRTGEFRDDSAYLKGGGPGQKPSGAPLRSGFTLIELLVVVLIIGILAAVAVPQYQKAVEKARATQALTLLRSMYQVAQVYLLANGQWPSSVADIDIEIPAELNDWKIVFYASDLSSVSRGANNGIQMTRKQGPYAGASFAIYQDRDTLYKDKLEMERIMCIEQTRNDRPIRFTKNSGDYCQKIMQGTFLSNDDGNQSFKISY